MKDPVYVYLSLIPDPVIYLYIVERNICISWFFLSWTEVEERRPGGGERGRFPTAIVITADSGGVIAAEGFKTAGMYGGLRALGQKPNLALVSCNVAAVAAGAFTQNVVAAAPVLYYTMHHRKILNSGVTILKQVWLFVGVVKFSTSWVRK